MTPTSPHILGAEFVCAVCHVVVDLDATLVFGCPHVTDTDKQHVLHIREAIRPLRPVADSNPFLSFRKHLTVDAFGARVGLAEQERINIISATNKQIEQICGTGFISTPITRQDRLSDALGFSALGGVWVKDETHNVAGSQKARHLFSTLLYLLMSEHASRVPWASQAQRPGLAIASCGNAAIAAATLARAVQWPITVFVPESASHTVLATLQSLGATVQECRRQQDDAPGDPCIHRFREAVAGGAIPFSVQGTENAWCLDGGRTIGWEIATDLDFVLDRIYVQVGGGAFASCVGSAFKTSGIHPRLHAVQTSGCAPLSRAWDVAIENGSARDAGARWHECMWPWEQEPSSLADGILDDETYDWISVLNAMADTGGHPIVAAESDVVRAHEMAHEYTDIDVSPTGAAGLAGLIQNRSLLADNERVALIFSGVTR
ncbi:MAG: PLP-dependent lyase/thiolase [Ilumatobacteraceae bacterium]|nr:PLP-dependent lyase/thiolase [Ilumatobacteraceae bacterium]